MIVLVVVIVIVLCLIVAALIYPGELSHVSSRLNRSLYDSAARNYQSKWRAPAYRDQTFDNAIADFAASACNRSGVERVLDLGCGTGRGIRIIAERLPPTVEFTGIDSSAAMLDQFRIWLKSQDDQLKSRIELVNIDLGAWSEEPPGSARFGLAMMLEVGEFVPQFTDVIRRIARDTADNGGLILTRPAKFWWLFFPGRMQSRKAMGQLLNSCGFDEPRFMQWRSRYELVFCRKNSLPNDPAGSRID